MRLELHPAVHGGRDREGADRSADAWTAEGGARGDEVALAHSAGREAGPLLLRAPGLLLGSELGRTAAGPKSERERHQREGEVDAGLTHGGEGCSSALKVALTTPPRV